MARTIDVLRVATEPAYAAELTAEQWYEVAHSAEWNQMRMLTGHRDSIVRSLLHMHMNRALPSSHRRHERVVYDYLARAYDGLLSMEKQRTPIAERA